MVLKVFDLLGRHVQTVVDGRHAPGRYQVRFDARGLPSGVYVYQREAGSYRARKTITHQGRAVVEESRALSAVTQVLSDWIREAPTYFVRRIA